MENLVKKTMQGYCVIKENVGDFVLYYETDETFHPQSEAPQVLCMSSPDFIQLILDKHLIHSVDVQEMLRTHQTPIGEIKTTCVMTIEVEIGEYEAYHTYVERIEKKIFFFNFVNNQI